jgi:UDP-galactopyranose mutase
VKRFANSTELTAAHTAQATIDPVWLCDDFEGLEETFDNASDLICFSHLRWNFVYQRPQHLMSRCARERRVFFIEEPTMVETASPHLISRVVDGGVCVVVPQLPHGTHPDDIPAILKVLIDKMYQRCGIHEPVLWYYTPMARSYTSHLRSRAIVYDCMDELSNFAGAPPSLKAFEADLLKAADVVFTGGVSLFEAKKKFHSNIHPFPSSIDFNHFTKSRTKQCDPADQHDIKRPRLGFAGVIDERLDVELLNTISLANPECQFVMIGPIVKIDPAILPRHSNIHYLGQKPYADLPSYFSGWDVGLLPFALNDATRFISPTKTPEYLAAGLPVISTPIRDVIRPYGEAGFVHIANSPQEWSECIYDALHESKDSISRSNQLRRIDEFLKNSSWDRTWTEMMSLIDVAIAKRDASRPMRARAI